MQKKYLYIGIAVILVLAILGWLFYESTKPLPGQKEEDQGRDHVPIGTKVDYKTNPPTSGPHYADWTRAGVYDKPQDDRNLVHSLEHGYVIMSYNCGRKLTNVLSHPVLDTGSINKFVNWIPAFAGMTFVGNVFAHNLDEEVFATSSGESTDSAALSESFNSENCHELVDQLTEIYEKKGKKKLIVVPRPNLDTKIAITAWNYLDKFNPSTSSGLSEFDEGRIIKFIDAHFDNGPERTME